MKTDSLFYELFRLHPESLFELARLEADGEYVFESITVKSTEKRMDGFFRRTDGGIPDGFLEVQGYYDRMIYWRFFREIATQREQSKSEKPFVAIILFIDKKYDPQNCSVNFISPNRLIRLYLPDCLKSLGDRASPLTVLKPLVFSDKRQLSEAIPKWKTELDSLKLSESTSRILIELLENAILSRFPKMTLKEIQTMIHLTPLDQTVAGQELIQIGMNEGILKGFEKGRIEGHTEGIEKGKIIGKIHATQRFLKRRITSEKKLLSQTIDELKAKLRQLEAELRIV